MSFIARLPFLLLLLPLFLWHAVNTVRPQHNTHVQDGRAGNKSELLMCQPVCVKCNDGGPYGGQMVIMRDMNNQQFVTMLSTQAVTTVAQTAVAVTVPGGPLVAYVVNKAADKALAVAIEGIKDVLEGEDKCSAVAVISSPDLPLTNLTPYGSGYLKFSSSPRNWNYLHLDGSTVRVNNYVAAHGEPPSEEALAALQMMPEIDLWRKSLDVKLHEERAEAEDYNMAKVTAQEIYEWAVADTVTLPSKFTDVLADSDFYCKNHGGVKHSFLVGNRATWAIKNPWLFNQDAFQAASHICDTQFAAADGVANAGVDCWWSCNKKQGACEYCGRGYCCQEGWSDTSNGCDGTFGGIGRHECVSAPVAP